MFELIILKILFPSLIFLLHSRVPKYYTSILKPVKNLERMTFKPPGLENCIKLVQNGLDLSKMAQTCQNWFSPKILYYPSTTSCFAIMIILKWKSNLHFETIS